MNPDEEIFADLLKAISDNLRELVKQEKRVADQLEMWNKKSIPIMQCP